MEGFFLFRLLIATRRCLGPREAGSLGRNQFDFRSRFCFLIEHHLQAHKYTPCALPPVDVENQEHIVDHTTGRSLADHRTFKKGTVARPHGEALFKCPLLAFELSMRQLGCTDRHGLFFQVVDAPRDTPQPLLVE